MTLTIRNDFLVLFGRLLLACLFYNELQAAPLPPADKRAALLDSYISTINRIDGEGLIPRKNRPETWKKTVSRAKEIALKAKTKTEFGRALKLIDAAYTNLHAKVVLDTEFDPDKTLGKLKLAVTFWPETVTEGQKAFKYRISKVREELFKPADSERMPKKGDELLAINEKPMLFWSNENFNFCKFPKREQCEIELYDNFRKELNLWTRKDPLTMKLKRGTNVWQVQIPFEAVMPAASDETSPSPCVVDKYRYPGFTRTYQGHNICVFENELYKNTTLLRIQSFAYRNLPESAEIKSLNDEVEEFWKHYWQVKAKSTTRLIIDLIDNGGGDTPIEWYTLFLNEPFQEQYVQYKRIKELEDPNFRKQIFYHSEGKEKWYQSVESTKTTRFTSSVPQFCAEKEKNCSDMLFLPRKHGFQGDVHLLVNQYCISSCVGFVWQLKDKLKGRTRLHGIPDSGDSNNARIYVDLYPDKVVTAPRLPQSKSILPANAIARQTVTVTRTTTKKGFVLSGIPTRVDNWITEKFHHSDNPWEAQALLEALK